jgi:hypothetical protein
MAWWMATLALGAWRVVAHHAVPRQMAVGEAQPGPPQFCHTDTDAQHAADGSAKAPQADRAAGPQWSYQSRSRRW